jgi:hypothetical protein
MYKTSRQNKESFQEFSNKVIFYGNSPLEWKDMKPKIINEFKGENCWELVDPELGRRVMNLEDGSVFEYFEEHTFNEVEPNREQLLEEKTNAFDRNIKKTFKSTMDMIVNAVGKTDEWRADEVFKAKQSKIAMESKRPTAIESFEKSFRELQAMWTRKQAEHCTKVASVIKVYNRCLAKIPKSVITLPFDAHKFREAWSVLDAFYFTKLSDVEIEMEVELKLMELRYTEKGGLEGLLNQLNLLYSHSKNDQSDLAKKQTYLMHSLNESNHPFKDVLSNINVFASMENLDYNGIVEALRRRDREMKNEKRKKQNPNHLKDYALMNDAEDTSSNKKQKVDKSNLWCTECQREGHTIDNCFTLVACPICNEKGHGARWCPVEKKKKKKFFKNVKKSGGGNGKGSQPPKTKAMFQKNNPKKGKA